MNASSVQLVLNTNHQLQSSSLLCHGGLVWAVAVLSVQHAVSFNSFGGQSGVH